jgi:hypothetical protein
MAMKLVIARAVVKDTAASQRRPFINFFIRFAASWRQFQVKPRGRRAPYPAKSIIPDLERVEACHPAMRL